MKKLAIVGAGDLGRQIAWHAIQDKQFEVAGFFDDFQVKGMVVNNLPVLGGVNDIASAFSAAIFDELLIGIGYKHMAFRKELYLQHKGRIPFARLVHSSCIIDDSCTINEGVVIYPGCIIDQQVVIGENVLLNVGCCIAHDTTIGAHTFLSPRVAIAGFVRVEEGCNIGINATIIDNIVIAAHSQIGGGGVVIKDIAENGLYVGNPVRFIR